MENEKKYKQNEPESRKMKSTNKLCCATTTAAAVAAATLQQCDKK